MQLPELDISALPDLGEAPGIYGSRRGDAPKTASIDDRPIVVMVYLYDVIPHH